MHSFDSMFSLPREPRTAIGPGQSHDLSVPEGKKVIVTDVYIENLGGGGSNLMIFEQTSANSFEVRYSFSTQSGQTKIINFTTGLRLGDVQLIHEFIRIENSHDSDAAILARINGFFVP